MDRNPKLRSELRNSVVAARKAYAERGGAVLDHLLSETTPADADAVLHWLPAGAGVRGLWLAEQASCMVLLTQQLTGSLPEGAFLVLPAGETQPLLAMADPWSERNGTALDAALGYTPELAAATSSLLASWGAELSLDAAASQSAEPHTGASVQDALGAPDTPNAHRTAGGPVVAFVDEAISAAYRDGASDIHFECDRQGVTVKLRLDGVMRRFSRLNGFAQAEEVISRIKVMAQLDITERRTPQDGRLRFQASAAAALDLRVSIMPSIYGEDAVLRLLDKARLRSRAGSISLEQLGFEEVSSNALRQLSALPHGMLLVTGPTGSGKTTTLYALLSEINNGEEKIITIEDPVEYELSGVLQIPVNERKGLTFERGLRSILRHDPDRILVGEIRDPQTAEIAVQSALTGHQVYTTVHANSIFDVIGRFKHFGLDMFGFLSSLNGVVVQRLVRSVCQQCHGSREATQSERQWLDRHGHAAELVAVPKGCAACQHTGYRGRSVVAEVHVLDDVFRDMVTSGATLAALREHDNAIRTASLQQQAARLVARQTTTLEEVRRVVGWMEKA
jgi:general secretion pathway protein E